jgi:hypothetical protein
VGRAKPSSVGTVEVSPVPLIDREAAAAYAASLSAELASLMRRHHLTTLGYLFDLARLEAEQIIQKADAAPVTSDANNGTRPSDQRK